MRRILALIFLFLTGVGLLLARPAHAAAGDVYILEIKGVVSPGMVSFFERGVAEAEAQEAALILVVLDTPGGLVDSTLEIVQTFRNSDVPIVVFVGPAGAKAASAGAIITMAGHLSAMAPETAIGASSPIAGSGQAMDETAFLKAVEFLSAEVRSLTERRGDDALALAESMVSEARAVTGSEALAVGLIDFIAPDVDSVLAELDGRTVELKGATRTLATATAARVTFGETPLEQFQMLLASNTELIGLLLSIGVFAIYVELRAPGGYLAGAIGIVCLGLAFYALGQLPTNLFGLGLIALAFLLYILETQTPTFGLLSLAGTAALIGGLVLLFYTEEAPDVLRISISSAIGIALPLAALFILIAVLMARAQRSKPHTGVEGMLGAKGVVRKSFKPHGERYAGMVLVRGELWRAEADQQLEDDTPVVIERFEGFTIHVRPAGALIEA